MMTHATATFGAGCFWCLESAMHQLQGVITAVSGYMGGATLNPTYRDICTGHTGHAEVVQITFDEELISYRQLCLIFFSLHDPTQLNRQGNDIGTQYRSVIFWHTPEQAEEADAIIEELTNHQLFDDDIVTEVTEAKIFYPAEEYHQGYYLANPEQGYCQFIIAPKMAKFRQQFQKLLK